MDAVGLGFRHGSHGGREVAGDVDARVYPGTPQKVFLGFGSRESKIGVRPKR